LNLEATNTVIIELLDINGKMISTLQNSELSVGAHELNLNIDNLSLQSGNYLINIKIGDRLVTKKIVKA
jgi:hypothetical protein